MRLTITFAPPALLFAMVAGCNTSSSSSSLTGEQLRDPQTCKDCHQDQFADWAGSMHAYSSKDPVFIAMNKRGQRETNGALGTFCVKCHAPLAVATGATTDGLNLDQLPDSMKGVN